MSSNKKNGKKERPYTDSDQVKAVFERLRWLNHHYNQNIYEMARFEPVNREILEHLCMVKSKWSWKEFGKVCRSVMDVRLYSDDGKFVGQVCVDDDQPVIRAGWRVTKQTKIWNETVIHALERLGSKQKIRWVIVSFQEDGDRPRLMIGKLSDDWLAKYDEEVMKASVAAKAYVEESLTELSTPTNHPFTA
jgi:hypothetical protein